jgi:hypothetical protein
MAAQVQTSLFDNALYVVTNNPLPQIEEKQTRKRYNRWKNFYTTEMYDYSTYHKFCVDVWDKSVLINNLWLALKTNNINLFNALSLYAIFVFPADYKKDERTFREWFYILDENGKRQPLGDYLHIHRMPTIYKIYRKIYDWLGLNPLSRDINGDKFEDFTYKGLKVWRYEFAKCADEPTYVDYGAEIYGSSNIGIKDRVTLHIKLLRLLRKGFSIEESLRKIERE